MKKNDVGIHMKCHGQAHGKKNSCVSTNSTNPISNSPLCYFLSVKMQNKKVKHQPSTKYLYFHKITGSTLFFSGEKIEK